MVVSHSLNFGARLLYDPALPGITVPVRLLIGEVWVETDAKLDTGSSHSVFAREIAEALGIVVGAGEPIRIATVNGAFLAYGHTIAIRAIEQQLDAMEYFAAEYGFPRNVLGRRGFIDRLRLGIVDYDGVLLASAYDDALE